jgi:acyl-CoA-dependent ceramide synthase
MYVASSPLLSAVSEPLRTIVTAATTGAFRPRSALRSSTNLSLSQNQDAVTGTPNGKRSTKRLSKRRRTGVLSSIRQTMVKHTFVLPACILVLMVGAYLVNPSESNPMHRFLFLSYELPHSGKPEDGYVQYGKGLWDIAFVGFYTVVLSFVREFVMQELLRPIARRAGLSRGKQARFMEQAYTAFYFTFLGPAGMYIMSRTPVWYFNTRGMYEDFPHKTHDAQFKFYYLFQAAYWAQQAVVLVLGMEKPRKDFKELVGHHIVTLALIALSYRFHFSYIGVAVYTTHDISDWFLASVKVLHYLDHPILAPFYAVFMCAWIYLRHYINLRIIWSLFTEFQTIGPFELNWETEQYKCRLSQYITSSLLITLQALNLFWLFYIVRIAYRMVALKVAADDRSDDEDDDEVSSEDNQSEKAHFNGHAVTNGTAKR